MTILHKHHNLQLINTERTWRWVICINPKHETIRFRTNEVGNIECPICLTLMVTEIISPFDIISDELNK